MSFAEVVCPEWWRVLWNGQVQLWACWESEGCTDNNNLLHKYCQPHIMLQGFALQLNCRVHWVDNLCFFQYILPKTFLQVHLSELFHNKYIFHRELKLYFTNCHFLFSKVSAGPYIIITSLHIQQCSMTSHYVSICKEKRAGNLGNKQWQFVKYIWVNILIQTPFDLFWNTRAILNWYFFQWTDIYSIVILNIL